MIILSLNTHSLKLHLKNILTYQNVLTSIHKSPKMQIGYFIFILKTIAWCDSNPRPVRNSALAADENRDDEARERERAGGERERGQRSARASAAMGAIRLLHERLRHSSNAKLVWSITGVMSTLLVYGVMQVK